MVDHLKGTPILARTADVKDGIAGLRIKVDDWHGDRGSSGIMAEAAGAVIGRLDVLWRDGSEAGIDEGLYSVELRHLN